MIDAIGQPYPVAGADSSISSTEQGGVRQKAQEEFMVYFYQELLKQSIKVPSLGLDEEEKNKDGNSLLRSFSNEIFLKQVARQIVADNSQKINSFINKTE